MQVTFLSNDNFVYYGTPALAFCWILREIKTTWDIIIYRSPIVDVINSPVASIQTNGVRRQQDEIRRISNPESDKGDVQNYHATFK